MGVCKRVLGMLMAKEPVPQPIQALVGLVPWRDPEAWKEKKRLERELNQAQREAQAEREALQWESRQAEKEWANHAKKNLAAANATGDRCGNTRSRSSGTDREGPGQVCLRSTTVVGTWTELAKPDVAIGGSQVFSPPAAEASELCSQLAEIEDESAIGHELPKEIAREGGEVRQTKVDPKLSSPVRNNSPLLSDFDSESGLGHELPQPAASGWYRLGRDFYRIGDGPCPSFGTTTTMIECKGSMVQRWLF
jgi:hypothetical protein